MEVSFLKGSWSRAILKYEMLNHPSVSKVEGKLRLGKVKVGCASEKFFVNKYLPKPYPNYGSFLILFLNVSFLKGSWSRAKSSINLQNRGETKTGVSKSWVQVHPD